MSLGKRIKDRREFLRMTQGELAKRARITQGLLSRIERGVTPNPGANVLRGIARALTCSIDYLVDLYADEPPDASWLLPAALAG